MKERKEKKRWGLIAFMVVVMIGTTFSFVFFGFSGVNETIGYKGIKFVRVVDRWEAKIQGVVAAFSFLPSEVEDIKVQQDIFKKLQNKYEIDATSEVNSTFKEAIALAEHQMGLTLSNFNVYLGKGFTNSSYNFPVITCNASTDNVPVVYFRQANSTRIYSEGKCVIAEAPTNSDFTRVKDRLLYGILGVME